MKRLFQHLWHDIIFNTFIETSISNIASYKFYDNFYLEFFKKYESYRDIRNEYILKKIVVVKFLEEKIQSMKSLLSIGFGIGLIEKLLIERISISHLIKESIKVHTTSLFVVKIS